MTGTVESTPADKDQKPRAGTIRIPLRLGPVSASVIVLLVVAVVFSGYFFGQSVPPWDFVWNIGDVYSWWNLGSFFHPPQYLPYTNGGYPAALNLGNIGWYLPVGIPAELLQYTPRVAAFVQALVVWAGCVGLLQLLRHWGITTWVACVCAVAFVFNPGFISMAEHGGYVAAWAFLPWLLLLLSPRRNPRWWLPVVATVVWWQFFLGAYPGAIVAFAYMFAAFIVTLLIRNRRFDWRYVSYAVLPVVAGALMSALKWVPYALTSTGDAARENILVTNLGSVATILFPFGSNQLANDISMRTWFVVPIIFLAVFFIRGRTPLVIIATVLVAVSLVLGVTFSAGTEWQSVLPLLDFSRFRTVDFKIGVVVGLFMLGAAGIQSMSTLKPTAEDQRFVIRRGIVALAVTAAIVVSAYVSPLTSADRNKGMLWILVSIIALIIVVAVLVSGRSMTDVARVVLTGLILGAMAAGVGFSWASGVNYLWNVDRINAETDTWGQTAASLLSNQQPASGSARSARTGPQFPTTEWRLKHAYWSSGAYSRIPSIGGYTNLRGQPIFEELMQSAP
ncbi:MAG: hypothetical protein WCI74_14075, partial [Actinomycetes bacterium]